MLKNSKKISKSNNIDNYKIDLDKEIVIGLKKPTQKPKKNNKKKKRKYKNKKEEEKAIKKRNFILKITKWVILLGLLIGTSIYIILSPLFNITEINVSGNSKLTSQDIINLSQIETGINTFKISLRKVTESLKQEPYIESVNIERKLPNTINISVKERVPTYMLEFANGFVYMNNQGYMLEISETALEVPIIVGFETPVENISPGSRLIIEDLEKLETVLKIVESAKSNDVYNLITSIDISDGNNFILYLNNEGHTVEFGDGSNINTKILYMKDINIRESGNSGTIILYSNPVRFRADI